MRTFSIAFLLCFSLASFVAVLCYQLSSPPVRVLTGVEAAMLFKGGSPPKCDEKVAEKDCDESHVCIQHTNMTACNGEGSCFACQFTSVQSSVCGSGTEIINCFTVFNPGACGYHKTDPVCTWMNGKCECVGITLTILCGQNVASGSTACDDDC